MADEDVKALAGIDAPHPQGGVSATAHHLSTVKMHASYRGRVTEQSMYALTGLRVPHLKGAVCAAAYHGCA